MERMMFMLNLWFKSNYCYQEELNIMPNDIEITIFETPSHNWGIRGLPGDELSLDYNIKIQFWSGWYGEKIGFKEYRSNRQNFQ